MINVALVYVSMCFTLVQYKCIIVFIYISVQKDPHDIYMDIYISI